MINAVVPFGSGATERVTQEQMYNPGAYAMPVYVQEPVRHKSGGSFLGTVGKLLLAAGLVGGGLVAARAFIKPLSKDVVDVSEKVSKDAGVIDKAKYYAAKSADYIENKSIDIYDRVVVFLKGKKAKDVE